MIEGRERGDGLVNWMPYHAGGSIAAVGRQEIHLWRAPLDLDSEKLSGFEAILSPDEQARAARFRFPEHRNRFVCARGILRTILGIHLGSDSGLLKFVYGEHGKPALAEPAGTGLEFNVSHSADLAVYAVARGWRVGVDVERIKADGSWLKIAETYFTADEASRLAALDNEEMAAQFFKLWAAKEADMKARGVGLRFSPDEHYDPNSWRTLNFCIEAGYAAALAFEAKDEEPVIIRHQFVP